MVPIGQGEIHAGYDRSKLSGSLGSLGVDNKVDQLKAGYVYNLSKRTALYTNVSRLKNGSDLAPVGGERLDAEPGPDRRWQLDRRRIRHPSLLLIGLLASRQLVARSRKAAFGRLFFVRCPHAPTVHRDIPL